MFPMRKVLVVLFLHTFNVKMPMFSDKALTGKQSMPFPSARAAILHPVLVLVDLLVSRTSLGRKRKLTGYITLRNLKTN